VTVENFQSLICTRSNWSASCSIICKSICHDRKTEV